MIKCQKRGLNKNTGRKNVDSKGKIKYKIKQINPK